MWRSGVLALAGVALAGCSGGGSPEDEGSFTDPDTGGKAIKVSIVWFPPPDRDPRTKVATWRHQYRYMLSQGWVNKWGKTPKEPFERLYRDAWKADEGVQDSIMEAFVRRLEEVGLGQLRETPLDMINLEALRRIERTNDGATAQRTLIITVESENIRKTVTLADNFDAKGELAGPLLQTFRKVQIEALKVLMSYTVQATVEKSASTPK